MRIVISQPMFFPWVGLLEQVSLADVWVHYDDVQFSKGSFTNRVQVKAPEGTRWLTVPLEGQKLGDRIDEVATSSDPFRARHLAMLATLYRDAPFKRDMLALVEEVYAEDTTSLADIAIKSFDVLVRYFELGAHPTCRSSGLDVPGSSSERVLDLVTRLGGTEYITGHGAKNYLDHDAFEERGVSVSYMLYGRRPYPQLHGEFTPFVSALDLVANRGRDGREVMTSRTMPWREFLAA
jgi:hypothetical protein